MRSVYYVKKSVRQIRNDLGVHECYICGALTDSAEAHVTLCREDHGEGADSEAFRLFAHEQDVEFIRMICPNEKEKWHIRIKKLMNVLFRTERAGESSKTTRDRIISHMRDILKKHGSRVRFSINSKKLNKPDFDLNKWKWDPFLWNDAMHVLHGHPLAYKRSSPKKG